MSSKAQGTTFTSDGAVYASVTVAAQKRFARTLPFVALDDAATAKAWASTLQELVDALRQRQILGLDRGRTGHRSTGQIANHKRPARMVAELGLGPLAPLDAALPECSAREAQGMPAKRGRSASPRAARSTVKTGSKCTGRDLNSYALRRRNLKTGEDAATSADERDPASDAGRVATDGDASLPALPRSAAASDAIEIALAKALEGATAAGRFDVVAQLARELEARRLACEPNVVRIPVRRNG